MVKFWMKEVNLDRKWENYEVLDEGSKFGRKRQKLRKFWTKEVNLDRKGKNDKVLEEGSKFGQKTMKFW